MSCLLNKFIIFGRDLKLEFGNTIISLSGLVLLLLIDSLVISLNTK